MSYLGSNIKYLRNRKKWSQASLAEQLDVPRSSLSDYERGHTFPGIDCLVKICEIFDVSLDDLVRTQLSHKDLEIIRNKDLRVLAISVDSDNKSNIELVDTKAEAGYLEQFNNPEYIRDLPKISFPNIPEGTFRGFEIQGDSMLPLMPGSIVICSYVEKIEHIRDNKTYVIISRDSGVVYKRVRKDTESNSLLLMSDNDLYFPYKIPYSDVAEIWQYYAHLSFTDQKLAVESLMEERMADMQSKITRIYQDICH